MRMHIFLIHCNNGLSSVAVDGIIHTEKKKKEENSSSMVAILEICTCCNHWMQLVCGFFFFLKTVDDDQTTFYWNVICISRAMQWEYERKYFMFWKMGLFMEHKYRLGLLFNGRWWMVDGWYQCAMELKTEWMKWIDVNINCECSDCYQLPVFMKMNYNHRLFTDSSGMVFDGRWEHSTVNI